MQGDNQIGQYAQKLKSALGEATYLKRKVSTVLAGCGYKKLGATNRVRIQTALEAVGVYPEPRLTTAGVAGDDWLYMSSRRPTPYTDAMYEASVDFESEKQFQLFVKKNFNRIQGFDNLKEPQREFLLPGHPKWRVDLLCREKISNDYVVVEMKRHDNDPVDQILKYLRRVEKLAVAERVGVRGVILTPHHNSALVASIPERIPNYRVDWMIFKLLASAKTVQLG